MKVNQAGIDLIKSFEGLVLKAYPDPATGGEPITIAYGCTVYPNGKKVKIGDVCTEQEAVEYLTHDIKTFSSKVSPLIKSTLNDNQYSALVSFAYNVGVGNLKSSTLSKKVNTNPNDPTISAEFLKWNKGGGKVMSGLTRRRNAEAQLYFTK
jgi:lysozyme